MCKLKPIIEFKEHIDQFDFMYNNNVDSRVKVITQALAGFVYMNFGKSLIITEIMRSQEMQDKYYADDPEYQKNPFNSVHQFGRGIDFSLQYFTDDEIKQIEKYLNSNFIYTSLNPNIKTAIVHNKWGWHLHLQVDTDNITSILKQV